MNEANLLIESFAIKRSLMLENIALDQMMHRDKLVSVAEINRTKRDNILTEVELKMHMDNRMPPEGHELHVRACEESGVPQCICFAYSMRPRASEEMLL